LEVQLLLHLSALDDCARQRQESKGDYFFSFVVDAPGGNFDSVTTPEGFNASTNTFRCGFSDFSTGQIIIILSKDPKAIKSPSQVV
jgi:hypothetical protein